MPPSNTHPVLVAYDAARNGVVHIGHSDRDYVPGFGTPAIPLCRTAEVTSRSAEVDLLNRYVIVPVAHGGGVNCRACLALMSRLPELQTPVHRSLVYGWT